MSELLLSLIAFIAALGILITVHEFGHFWVARRTGVKVLRFSIGFGRPLYRRVGRVDATEYVVAAIPLGGYVKMLDEREGEVAPEEVGRAFNRQPLKVRSAIVAAGPLFNLAFAVVAFWLVFVIGDVGMRPLIGAVEPDSIAERAGFEVGDEVVAIGARETPTWENMVYALLAESLDDDGLRVEVRDAGGSLRVRWLDGRELRGLTESRAILSDIGLTPQRPVVPAVIGELVPGEPAERDGLQVGDLILSADGEPIDGWSDWVEYVRAHPGQRVALAVERAGGPLALELTIGVQERAGETIGRIGAAAEVPDALLERFSAELKLGPVDALVASLAKTGDLSLLMLKIVGKMITGQVSVKNISGPISIAETAGRSASYGYANFLKFLALVSISLGILNLLPIPVLDGGHLLFFLIEGLRGRPLSEAAQIQAQKIGIVLLVGLMGLAFYVDLSRLLG